MRVTRFLAALALSAGVAFTSADAIAGGANDRVDGNFVAEDNQCDHQGGIGDASVALFEFDGEQFGVGGYVSGIGTNGDHVEISYSTDLPDSVSASNRGGTVSQKTYSRICVLIESDEDRDINGCDEDQIFPQKCSVKGTLKTSSNSAKVTVSCSDTDLYLGDGFLSQAQLDSLLEAFPRGNPCGVKIDAKGTGQKSSLSIRLSGNSEEIP